MKICCVFNYNSLYRLPIYSAMADVLDCDFFFGDTLSQPIKAFDANLLKGFQGFIKRRNKRFMGMILHTNLSGIFNKKYSHYILTGDINLCVDWLIILYAKLTKRKVYLWTHGLRAVVGNFYKRFLYKLFFAHVDGLLMYNRYGCQFMENIGCKKERLFVFHNSLDTELQTRIYSSLSPTSIYKEHFGNDNPVLIYIGRIQRVKKTEQILDAMHILRTCGLELNLVMVGANVDDNVFDNKIDLYDLKGNVWMYGPCFDESKNAELIYNASVCVSPGNVGLTCIHALSYGTPIITNNNFAKQMPEFEAIKEGVTGDFFEENNIEDLADKIKKWVLLSKDKRARCRQIARRTIVEEWSVDYQIELLQRNIK